MLLIMTVDIQSASRRKGSCEPGVSEDLTDGNHGEARWKGGIRKDDVRFISQHWRDLSSCFLIQDSVCRFLPRWQEHGEDSPTPPRLGAALHANRSMVSLHDVRADPKPQARSDVFLGSEKRLEKLGPVRGRNAL